MFCSYICLLLTMLLLMFSNISCLQLSSHPAFSELLNHYTQRGYRLSLFNFFFLPVGPNERLLISFFFCMLTIHVNWKFLGIIHINIYIMIWIESRACHYYGYLIYIHLDYELKCMRWGSIILNQNLYLNLIRVKFIVLYSKYHSYLDFTWKRCIFFCDVYCSCFHPFYF